MPILAVFSSPMRLINFPTISPWNNAITIPAVVKGPPYIPAVNASLASARGKNSVMQRFANTN